VGKRPTVVFCVAVPLAFVAAVPAAVVNDALATYRFASDAAVLEDDRIVPFASSPPAAADHDKTPSGRGPDPTLTFRTGTCSQCVHMLGSITVALDVSDLPEAINGVQALFHYDNAVLSFSSMLPGDGVGSPWDMADVIFFEDDAGDVTLAFVLNGGGSALDATVATLDFSLSGQGITQVGFRLPAPPFLTKLTTASGSATILPVEVDSGDVIVGQTSKGDVDGDGLRNGDDVQGFVDVLLNPGDADPAMFCAADMNGDGVIDLGMDGQLFIACLLTGECVCP